MLCWLLPIYGCYGLAALVIKLCYVMSLESNLLLLRDERFQSDLLVCYFMLCPITVAELFSMILYMV